MQNIGLFLVSAIIWGPTWIMITFQLGKVDPIVSIIYRFGLASIILLVFCWLRKKSFNFNASVQKLMLMQGLLLFGFNYWLTYLGIEYITSALAAILSTSIVYFNVVFARIFLGDKIKPEVLLGATVGVFGIILIFLPEVNMSQDIHKTWKGIGLVLGGSLFASLGNIVSAKAQRIKIPVLQANTLSMGYATLFFIIVAFFSGKAFNFDPSWTYVGSLVYLALFGSVIAFGAFLTLLGRIGPDKAGYVTLVFPVIAMFFSSYFESYSWTLEGTLGLLLILVGNFIAMGKYRALPFYPKHAKP